MLDVTVRTNEKADTQVVTLTGEFGLSDQARVESLRFEVFNDTIKGVIFDLTAVTYMEEAGYETLMFYLQRLLEAGAYMAAVIKPESTIARKIRRMGFADVGLKVYDTLEEAERAIEDETI